MKMIKRHEMNVLIFLFDTVLVTLTRATYSVQNESQLQEDLLKDYNVNVRPKDKVSVGCGLNIQNLLFLDIVEQKLAVTGTLSVAWTDTRLTWNVLRHGYMSILYFKSDQIWRPTLVLQNSAIATEVIGDNGNQKSIPLTGSAHGGVFYFISYCSVDVSHFPFDTQTCELKISGWLYTKNTMQFIHIFDNITFDQFEENGEYDVIRTYTRIDRHFVYAYTTDLLVFGIVLRRKYSYYLINVVLPVLFTQLLGLVVFAVPTESGEKLTFSLTLLLSLTVMMTLVAEKIPTTSLQISTLSIYMLGGAVISSLEVIMAVIILYLNHYRKEDIRLSGKMQSFAHVLGLLICKNRNKIDSVIEETAMEYENQNVVITVEDLTLEGQVKQEKTGIPCAEREHFEDIDLVYTPQEIAVMMDKVSLVLFTIITLAFTFAMIVMLL